MNVKMIVALVFVIIAMAGYTWSLRLEIDAAHATLKVVEAELASERATAENLRSRAQTNTEVQALPPAKKREELLEWAL